MGPPVSRVRHRLCVADELAEGQSRQFTLALGERALELFAVNWQGRLYAYLNSCPHTGVALNWVPHQFFDAEGQFIQCAMHGAQFRPDDGYCVWGPCAGRSLSAVALEIDDGVAYARL